MRAREASLPTGRLLTAVDVAVAAWVLVWVVLAFVIAGAVEGLTDLSGTVEEVGTDVERAGGALGAVNDLPLVGGAFGDALDFPAETIQEAGTTAREGGASSTATIESLSLLLGLALALIPSAPVLAGYLPARVERAREAEALRRARRQAGDNPVFEEFLARRAAQHMSLRRLTQISPEPWRDLAEGRFEPLARAERERLGVG